jgi:hypothetical protein
VFTSNKYYLDKKSVVFNCPAGSLTSKRSVREFEFFTAAASSPAFSAAGKAERAVLTTVSSHIPRITILKPFSVKFQ